MASVKRRMLLFGLILFTLVPLWVCVTCVKWYKSISVTIIAEKSVFVVRIPDSFCSKGIPTNWFVVGGPLLYIKSVGISDLQRGWDTLLHYYFFPFPQLLCQWLYQGCSHVWFTEWLGCCTAFLFLPLWPAPSLTILDMLWSPCFILFFPILHLFCPNKKEEIHDRNWSLFMISLWYCILIIVIFFWSPWYIQFGWIGYFGIKLAKHWMFLLFSLL